MIEPIRGVAGFDISCSSCGVVERFTERFAIVFLRARSRGWMIGTPRAGRDHLCPDCAREARLPVRPE